MESISTPRSTRLPWAANLATLAVVMTAVWWSGAQRPAQAPVAQMQAAPLPAVATPPAPQPATATQANDSEPLPLRVQTESVDATVAQASVRAVVYKTVATH
jgi:hypothetical protein